MGKIAELQQTYQEISAKYDELYGNVEFHDLDENASNLLIERLEAELKLKEATVDKWRFERYFKPALLHRITRVKTHIENHRWLQSKVKQ